MATDLFDALFVVTSALERAGVGYGLVGGLAVAVHGAPRATTDIDLLIAPDDADKAVELAKKAGFQFEALPQQFSDGMRLRRVTHLWAVGRAALIAMKVQAGRAKDLADIERLTELDR